MADQNNFNSNQDPGFFGRLGEFLADNGRLLLTAIIIILLIVAGVYAFNQENGGTAQQNEEQVAQNETSGEGEQNGSAEEGGESESDNEETPGETVYEGEGQDNDGDSESQASEAEAQGENGTYTMTAERGDGVTHLARDAVSQYLENNPDQAEQVTPAHRVYLETVLTQRNYQPSLEVGETVSFSQSEVSNAVQDAVELPQDEVNDWQPYVAQVSAFSGSQA